MVSGVSESGPAKAGGRPEYKPTDEQRARVRELVNGRVPQKAIASLLGISPVTLRKHFAAELRTNDQAGQLDLTGTHHTTSKASPAPGRPAFEPTRQQREDVQNFKADGWSNDRIARRLRISPNTLARHFAEELSDGADSVRAEALRRLRQSSREGNMTATINLLKLTGLEPPPAPIAAVQAPVEKPEPRETPGKKAQALQEAQTAEQGTSWQQLMN